eukprot:3895_1
MDNQVVDTTHHLNVIETVKMKHDSDEKLNTTSLENAAKIIHHGLFKLYWPMKNVFVDVAGILTEKQLYKIWKELIDRSGTEHEDNQMISLSSFDRMDVIELNKYQNISPVSTSNSYGFCMNDNKSNTITISSSSNNCRHGWITHLDYVIANRTINSHDSFEQKQTCNKTEEENEYDTDFTSGIYLNYWQTNVQNSVIPKYIFCGGNGIVLQLKALNHSQTVRCFDTTWISKYSFKQERLFIGSSLKMCDIYIDHKSSKDYVSALQMFENILNGYQIDSKPEIEHELYLIIQKLLGLNDYIIPEYIEKLFIEQIDIIKYKSKNKTLWINLTSINSLNHAKLKCLFGACQVEQNTIHDLCGTFFKHFGIDNIDKVKSFKWKFYVPNGNEVINSPNIDYVINKEKIVFHLTFYPNNQFERCGLFLHIDLFPHNIKC